MKGSSCDARCVKVNVKAVRYNYTSSISTTVCPSSFALIPKAIFLETMRSVYFQVIFALERTLPIAFDINDKITIAPLFTT